MRAGRILLLILMTVLPAGAARAGVIALPIAQAAVMQQIANDANHSTASSAAPPAQPTEDRGIMELVQGNRRVSLHDIFDPAFWVATIRELLVLALGLVPRVVAALIFLFIFWVLHRAARRVAVTSMDRAHLDASVRDMLASLLKWVILGFGLVIAFNQIGIQITALLAGVSIIGLAVGFAAQETLANFIAGAVIFWDKPFRVGDWIEVHDELARVMRITFRSTRLLNYDGQLIVMPNTLILSGKISNHSAHPMTRISVPIGIGYENSIDKARETLLGMLAGDGRIAADPKPSVVVTECAASSVNLVLRFWVTDISLQKPIFFEYLEKAKKSFDAAGINIPYPYRQILISRKRPEN